MVSLPAFDDVSVQYPYAMPTPYKCQVEESCKGGLESPCGDGYKGPLCAVCSSGYYKQLQSCTKCPSKKWIAGQLSIIAVILLILLVLCVWKSKKTSLKDQGFSQTENFFSNIKIIIGFYQVTRGLLDVFSYVRWPDSLEVVAEYSGILQMNLLQVAPIHCLFPGLRADAFGELFAILTINVTVIGVSAAIYIVRKIIILRNPSLEDEEKLSKISQTKELVYKNVFFVLYVTYLSSWSKTASVLPFACRKLCKDKNEELCNEFLKADYSIQCQGPTYNHLVIVAYISTAYVFALPVASFIALWRKRRVILMTTVGDKGSRSEMITGLSFLFENYRSSSWYWELVEMSRKVILTSGLILVGQESRSYIGLAWVVAGMYGMFFSWIKPIQDSFENRLMTTSLAVTVVNLGIGAVSRIRAENISDTVDKHTDTVTMKILILGANTLVIGLLVGKMYCLLLRASFKWSIYFFSFPCKFFILGLFILTRMQVGHRTRVTFDPSQEPITWSLHLHYILESPPFPYLFIFRNMFPAKTLFLRCSAC